MCACVCVVNSDGEDGLQRRVCALLSLPWVCESKSVSAFKGSGFPAWLPALAKRLGFCYCEGFILHKTSQQQGICEIAEHVDDSLLIAMILPGRFRSDNLK